VYPDRLRLSYKVLQGEGEWERVSETIQLDTTVCRYGGQRYWFRCPRCHRRTRILYINKRPYCCRVCLGLAYQSQRELATDRNLERWQSLLCRLGGGGSISQQPRPRPKGMQRRVYRRLLEEIADARLNFWVSVAERFHIAGSRSEDDEDADD
jgi:hypothetical protein